MTKEITDWITEYLQKSYLDSQRICIVLRIVITFSKIILEILLLGLVL
jgi:hypothetical protein